MNVLLAHNFYQQPGGEDQVFAAEAAILQAHGHRVERYTIHNERVAAMHPLDLVRRTLWNPTVYRDLRAIFRAHRIAVAHYHNTFPLISPAAYAAARAERVAVVQTLHNYRLVCPNALLFRAGQLCEACLGKRFPWPGIRHACYRQRRTASAVVAALLTTHRLLGTWRDQVDVYIALTEFARGKFIEGGLPPAKIVVKPNFVHPDPGVGPGDGGYALFVGRLSPEKGIATLLAAWERLGGQVPLKIVGDGPLAPLVAAAAARLPAVEWLGQQPIDAVYRLLHNAALLVVPSEWYEAFPRVIVEAFASGTPVIASDLGAGAELIDHGRTGWLVRPGDPEDLAAAVASMWAQPALLSALRCGARAEFEAKYTAEHNYALLLEIYRRAIEGPTRH